MVGNLKNALWFVFDDDSHVVVVPPAPLTIELVYLDEDDGYPYSQLEVRFSRPYSGVASFTFSRQTPGEAPVDPFFGPTANAYYRNPPVSNPVSPSYTYGAAVVITGGADATYPGEPLLSNNVPL